ncbi:MAG: hypothetical protein AB1492_00885 [Bacillota bacterium]
MERQVGERDRVLVQVEADGEGQAVSPAERVILESVAHGRNCLDHFVDRLGLDCAAVRGVAETLVGRGYLRRRGTWFGAGLSYALSDQGEAVIETKPLERVLRGLSVSSSDLLLLRKLMGGPVPRVALLVGQEAAAASQVSHLQDMGYVRVTGIFRGTVALTKKGAHLLSAHGQLLDTYNEEETAG